MALSEEEKKKFISQRDKFLELEKSTISKIQRNKENLARLVSNLETNRPTTPHGEYMCETCKTISMAYNSQKSEPETEDSIFTRVHVYDCEICGRTDRRYPEDFF